jgi:iron complex outermembrane receptor protein
MTYRTCGFRATRKRLVRMFFTFVSSAGTVFPVAAQVTTPAPAGISQLSPEELANLQVTSVSKKSEPLSDAPAAAYIITSEDIRRSAATNLSDVLRLAPNLQVASDTLIPGYISARGHNGGTFAGPNRMLVLIDGRSIYSLFFSGVLWDAQDLVLQDIERIEVISGPAGVLWGVNAVNGVINIITKPASATQGVLASTNLGKQGTDTSLRYGGKLEESGGSYRVYAKQYDRKESRRESDGLPTQDDHSRQQVGARADWDRASGKVSLQFNAYNGDEGQPQPGVINLAIPGTLPRLKFSGVNATARYSKPTDDGGSLALQAYVDHIYRSLQPAIDDTNDVLDLEFQRNLPVSGAHAVTFGGNFRIAQDRAEPNQFGIFPATVIQRWTSVFLQDEIALRPGLRLTAGARVERGAYGDTEILPSLRLGWRAAPAHFFWGGLSRSARGTTRLEASGTFPANGPFLIVGNPRLRSEKVDVVEVGYRTQGPRTNFAVNIYRNFHKDLGALSLTSGAPPFTYDNIIDGHSSGIEMWGDWKVTRDWKLFASLTGLTENYRDRPGQISNNRDAIADSSPGHTAQVRSSWNLGRGMEFDLAWRRAGVLGLPVPSYNAIDARLGWRVNRKLDVALLGQNLLGTPHAEYGLPANRATLPMQVFLKLTWRQ